jgi:hypothetical protein
MSLTQARNELQAQSTVTLLVLNEVVGDLTSGLQVHIRLGNWVLSGFESKLGFDFVRDFRGCPLPVMVKGRTNILHQWFPKCTLRMSRDPLPVPVESMGTFLEWLHWSTYF